MAEYYLEIRNLHICAVVLSGLLFTIRGLGLILHAKWPRSLWVKYPVYAVDTVLLMAALMLMTIVRQNPITDAWLSVKVLLLLIYIFLGICAFRTRQSQKNRIVFWLSALVIYAYIITVARAHHPLGFWHLI